MSTQVAHVPSALGDSSCASTISLFDFGSTVIVPPLADAPQHPMPAHTAVHAALVPLHREFRRELGGRR